MWWRKPDTLYEKARHLQLSFRQPKQAFWPYTHSNQLLVCACFCTHISCNVKDVNLKTRPWFKGICNVKHSFWKFGRAGIKFRMSVLLQITRTRFVFVLNPIKCCVESLHPVVIYVLLAHTHTQRPIFLWSLACSGKPDDTEPAFIFSAPTRISCVYMIRILRPPHWEPVFFASAVCLLADPLQRSGHCALLPRSMHETKQTPWQ